MLPARTRPASPTYCVSPSCSARRNISTAASFPPQDRRYAEGAFRYVAKGVYTNGSRRGEPTVSKWPKKPGGSSTEAFQDDIRISRKAIEIVDAWNESSHPPCGDNPFQVIEPEVWTWQANPIWKCNSNAILLQPSQLYLGPKVLQER